MISNICNTTFMTYPIKYSIIVQYSIVNGSYFLRPNNTKCLIPS